MRAQLIYVGRIACLIPAELGCQFEASMVVTTRKEEKSAATGWKKQAIYTPHTLWWRDQDPITGQAAFAFLSGYGPRVLKTLREQGHDVEVTDRKPSGAGRPDFSHARLVEFRGRQPQALALLATQRGGVILCPTGFGKTFLLKQFCLMYPNATGVITVPAITNARDIYVALREALPDLGMCGDGAQKVGRITVAVTHSIAHTPCDVDFVLVDECHMVAAKMHREALMRFSRAKFFGFTATGEGRSDGGDAFMEALFGPTLIEVEYQEAVASGNVVQLEVEILDCPDGPQVDHHDDVAMKRFGFWHNQTRNAVIANRVAREVRDKPQNQLLIMVETTEHAYVLAKLLPQFTLVHGTCSAERLAELQKIGVYDPEIHTPCTSKALRRHQALFTSGALRYVIATKIWSRGVDFKDLNVLVRADGAASIIDAGQIPGRLSRLGTDGQKGSGLLIDVADGFSQRLLGRALKRISTYQKNGWLFTDESELITKRARALHRDRTAARRNP